MAVMVTYNVQTDLDVANGSRGTIVDIILDEREPSIAEGVSEVQLKYQPAYLLVKMDRTKAERLDGLEDGVLPLVPLTRTFQISMTDGKSKTVNRTQLPLTAAYAFTDMRSQGQTIPYVVVDIAAPPTGGLTPFNTYVALSRSSGRDTIRLLRDFDDKLFTTLPCPMLELEDRWEEALDAATKEWWIPLAKKRMKGTQASTHRSQM